MSGIYIHVPFCKQACSYCDFYFVTQQSLRDQFVERLIQEIDQYRDTHYAREPVETIYLGGGTPSLLAADQVGTILSALGKVFPIQSRETTLEMNPDDVTAPYLAALQEVGITRASMGVQSFQPQLLTSMNRAHTREEALHCLELLDKSGFDAFTVDLIYGNPGQTQQQLSDDIGLLLGYNPPHISAYSLTVEPHTRLGKQVALGRIIPTEDESMAEQFALLNERFTQQNIYRYEVSNYSKKGAEAQHNSNYWNHHNYLGFGPGAHSFWWDERPRRWQNKPDLKNYLKGNDIKATPEHLSMLQLAEERMMMGLRTRRGISVKRLEERYHYSLNERQQAYINQQKERGFLHFDGDLISLTDTGIVIADSIVLDLVSLH